MSSIVILLLLFLLSWGFAPLRAIFPYLMMPLLILGFAIAFLFLGTMSSVPGF